MKNKSHIYDIELENKIKQDVFDQDMAISSLVKALAQSGLIETVKSNVKALFTFVGTNNCGKQFILETLAKYDPNIEKIKIFHMDQYSAGFNSTEEQVSAFTFQNEIINFIQSYPNSILLFKDIEKADLQVQLSLYTVLTEYEKSELNLSNTVIVIDTTRLSGVIKRKDFLKVLEEDPLQAHTFLIEKMSREYLNVNGEKEPMFNSKLLSLMNEQTIIPFKNLRLETLIKIATRSLHNISKNFTKQRGISIEYEEFDDIIWLLLLALSPYINAKYIKEKLPKEIFNNIYEAMKLQKEIHCIRCTVSQKTKKFLKEILKDKKTLAANINSKHTHLFLKWNIKSSKEEGIVECKIQDAFFEKEKLSISPDESFQTSNISFKDIAGHKKVKEELNEIISLLKEPQSLKNFELNAPKGMILYGPTGMGKKLLARAFAKEAGIHYTVIGGSDLFDPAKINKAYEKAYSNAPAVIIFEDIDTEGILNGMVSTMSVEPVINQLDNLQQSFDSPVFTILTTSDFGNVPPMLLQAHRINISIEVPKLDMEARRFFIEELLKKPHDENIDVERIVRYISGMGGNELKRVAHEASLYAARKGLNKLTEEILLEQINIIKYGTKLENKQIRDIETSMKKTAYHEAGHAVLSHILLPKVKIEQVTIAPRSETLGFVSYNNEDYIDATSKKELFDDICVLLAGRIAKMEKFGDDGMETGAISDLEAATNQAYAAIALFGMDEELGYINISSLTAGLNKQLFSEKIEQRIQHWIEKAKEKTIQEVKKHWKAIDAVAKVLIEKEMIDGDELKKIIETNMEDK